MGKKEELAPLVVRDVTEQASWRNVSDGCLLTLFPEAWVAFKKHQPDTPVYQGDENWRRDLVFEIEYERKYPVGVRKDVERLEVWYKGGDWNENPFYYFCIGRTNGSLFFIPQLSPQLPPKPEKRQKKKVLRTMCGCGYDNTKTKHKFCPKCGSSLVEEVREEEEEYVEIEPTQANISRFIKERFLTNDGEVQQEFKIRAVDDVDDDL